MLKNLHINIPFIEAIGQMLVHQISKRNHFKQMKVGGLCEIGLNEECSIVI